MLEGRAETSSVFTAYLIETDILGHIGTSEDCVRLLRRLSARIEEFRAEHPRHRLHFTFISDHGMDFTGVRKDRQVDFHSELPKAGIRTVEHLAGTAGLAAIPVVHTRLGYVALHTREEQIAEVGLHVSTLLPVDFAVGRITAPPGAPPARDWYGIWTEGRLAFWFGYLPESSSYLLAGDGARFGIPMQGQYQRVRDEDLFDSTRDGPYPDFLYRLRTGLAPLGVVNPAQVLISMHPGYASVGFTLPGAFDGFTPGTHGAADSASSVGILMSDERDLPEAVRADSVLALFPALAGRLHQSGLALEPGDPDSNRPLR